jgi:hypothetical protein
MFGNPNGRGSVPVDVDVRQSPVVIRACIFNISFTV